MTGEEYLNFLYDRAARRNGYESHAAERAESDARMADRMERLHTEERERLERWEQEKAKMGPEMRARAEAWEKGRRREMA